MRREKVSFAVGADACAGYLFIPEAAAGTDTRWPSVVLAHGFSGTMDRLLPHAERFAADGIAALVFDHRGFGESGGEPRQVVDLPSQQRDLRAAIAWVRGRDDLDPGRVALWGTTLWRNQVAPRGLLQMLRYRPALDAARLRAPLLVCFATDDTETPEAMTRELADRSPHETLRRYPGTHFDFYTDPSVRDRALADQLGFLHERLHISPRAA
jgi:fermentation-respiration switch protein FrsA (DUF1100 family)